MGTGYVKSIVHVILVVSGSLEQVSKRWEVTSSGGESLMCSWITCSLGELDQEQPSNPMGVLLDYASRCGNCFMMCIFEVELSRVQSTHWACAIMVDACNRNKGDVKAPTLRFHEVCEYHLFLYVVSNRCMMFLVLSMDV